MSAPRNIRRAPRARRSRLELRLHLFERIKRLRKTAQRELDSQITAYRFGERNAPCVGLDRAPCLDLRRRYRRFGKTAPGEAPLPDERDAGITVFRANTGRGRNE